MFQYYSTDMFKKLKLGLCNCLEGYKNNLQIFFGIIKGKNKSHSKLTNSHSVGFLIPFRVILREITLFT
jgi:hypothetical protein